MSRIRVAIQKSGRLSEKSLALLQNCGLRFARSKDKLFWYGKDFPVDLLLVRDDDIPRMLLGGVCEIGIVGENVAREVMLARNGGAGLEMLRGLDFGQCLPFPGSGIRMEWRYRRQGARSPQIPAHGRGVRQ